MSTQNYKNHVRLSIPWHFVTGGLILAVLIGSIVNLTHSSGDNLYSASLLVVISLILVSVFLFARSFALRVQDRAIRAEENFRHFVLTGKPLDKQLRLGQIIALRFASDDEMPALATKAVAEKLHSRQIKQLIQHWRPDYYRV
jgi:Na+/melibiose symporter-like transporter